jgi:aryl-alcohol dehydrogenase-like predicted oxidoreductase
MGPTRATLDSLVRAGKVRFLGASSHSGWQTQEMLDLAGQYGWEPYVCIQPLYNLLDRDTEWELVPLCRSEGLGLIAWSPLRTGLLVGSYHRGVAAETGRTPAEVSLRWLMQRPAVTAPVLGARTLAHIEDNLGAAGWELIPDQMSRLTTASDRRLPYPYDVIAMFSRS